jgi:hypothetical protein
MRGRTHGAARRTARRAARIAAFLAAGAVAACEFDERTVAPGRARPVVHAVLNPFGGREYHLFLERTLTGRIATRDSAFDPDDPIVSGEGEPITGALVIIYNEIGDSAIGEEVAAVRADGKGAGVYRFLNVGRGPFGEPPPPNGLNIARAQRYRLDITLPDGNRVVGTTTVPFPSIRPDSVATRVFDRERDVYEMEWPAAELTKRYAVQIQTPHGPFELFSAEPSISISGDLRNFFAERFPLVFTPGFRLNLQVLAVDENYFDYYRSVNDPFTGSGLLTHLDGASGVFGSAVPIRGTRVEVVAPIDEPGEGTWQPIDDVTQFPPRLTIYYSGSVASGRLDEIDVRPYRWGVLGARAGPRESPRLTLAVLEAQLATDTAYTLTAELRGDTLVTREGSTPGERRWKRVATTPSLP